MSRALHGHHTLVATWYNQLIYQNLRIHFLIMTPHEKLNANVETTISKLLQRWYPLKDSQEKTMYEQLYKTKCT